MIHRHCSFNNIFYIKQPGLAGFSRRIAAASKHEHCLIHSSGSISHNHSSQRRGHDAPPAGNPYNLLAATWQAAEGMFLKVGSRIGKASAHIQSTFIAHAD